jgi:diguanylate cyclase (GGDEF)-like protein/PAS domain S-box-containing protein
VTSGRKQTEAGIRLQNEDLLRLNNELAARAAALEEANATISRVAATDDLTGLANRRHFYETLDKAISLARRHGSPLAFVSLDLDGLKEVNDSAGHAAGDAVLTSFAALFGALCRAEDLAARLGGDEFGLLLPGIDLAGARGLAERVLAAVRSCAALAQSGVTASAGVAQWAPEERPDDLLRRADEALYAAKRRGGDVVAGGDAESEGRSRAPTEPEFPAQADVFVRIRETRRSLLESEIRYRQLFAAIGEGVALHEIVCDASGRPCDYRYLEVNPAFEKLTGLAAGDIVGRTVLEVIPDLEPVWIERYGRVALEGQPMCFEDSVAALGRRYEAHAWPPATDGSSRPSPMSPGAHWPRMPCDTRRRSATPSSTASPAPSACSTKMAGTCAGTPTSGMRSSASPMT